MAVGLTQPGELHAVAGVKLASVEAGIRYRGRPDLVIIELAEGSTTAAVFTQNKCCAAPVTVAKDHLQKVSVRALLINAGNANAVTGELGMNNALESCEALGNALGVAKESVLPFSTGVIGEQLNMPALLGGIKQAVPSLSEDGWLPAAEAIMTTDTLAKAISRQVEIDGRVVTITGVAKGSGMICPDMATLLAYVATDAEIKQSQLQQLLVDGTDKSFNRITVDSDTSTNDALVLMATGQSGVTVDQNNQDTFSQALNDVLIHLATAIIRDAEGATKFVKVAVNKGVNQADCRAVAYAIAHSPLVKTALFASDPNWGRILMALGKAPAEYLDLSTVDICINSVSLIEQGEPAPSYTEERGKAEFEKEEITIDISLNQGAEDFHVWTSDLSHDYVSINADYRS